MKAVFFAALVAAAPLVARQNVQYVEAPAAAAAAAAAAPAAVTTTVYVQAGTGATAAAAAPPAATQPAANVAGAPSAAPSAAAGSSSGADSGFADELLSQHNKYRAMHSAPALTWDTTLESYAQQHVAGCNFAHTGGPYGENLASGISSAGGVVDAWYNEISGYSFSNPGFSEATGHFTQVVWKASTQLGCASAQCGGGLMVFCEYQTAGNVAGQYQQNVS